MRISKWIFSILLLSSSTQALVIDEHTAFVYTSSLGSSSFSAPGIGHAADDITGSGLDYVFENNLSSTGVGQLNWTFTNNTGLTLNNVKFFAFLDSKIDQDLNTFFNEYGQLVDVSGKGASDIYADSWEIDEPGYVFGDIYDNLLSGDLDNTNTLFQSQPDDVSLALGFELGDIAAGTSWFASLEVNSNNIGGLSHIDPDSAKTYFYSGTVTKTNTNPTPIPEPNGFGLIGLLVICSLLRRRINH